jgi:hypothetical protein
MTLRVHLKIDEDEDEDEDEDGVHLLATFQYFLGSRELCSFTIFAPEVFKKQDYLDFADKKRTELVYGDSNGSVAMRWQLYDDNGGTVKCETSKFGIGGDGEAICYLPEQLIVPKLRELAAKVK